MARRSKLTGAGIARLRPATAEYTVWDTVVAGLGVRVRPSGRRNYVYRCAKKKRILKIALGSVALKSVAQARRECFGFWDDESSPPRSPPCSATLSFGEFVAGPWKQAVYDRYKPSTKASADSVLNRQLLPNFGPRPLGEIDRLSVARWFDACSATTPGGANSALLVFRQIMNFAISKGCIERNPAQGLRRNPRPKLTRFLSREEIRRLHSTLNDCVEERPSCRQQADIIRLLLLTGCRKNEILRLTWSEVDGGTLRLADSKTGPRRVLLSPEARALVERQPRSECPWVFPSVTGRPRTDLFLWREAKRRAGLDDVRLHDLRHTFASQTALQGVPLPVLAKLLGHAQVEMTLRYAHVADRDVEAAAERTGQVIAHMMGGR